MTFFKFSNLLLLLIFTNGSFFGKNTSIKFSSNLKISQEPINNQNDAEIISESNIINITGRKASFVNFSITKRIKYKILNYENIERLSTFILPETFDPTYISHSPKDRNYTYALSNLKVNYFKATIKDKNNEVKDATVIMTIDHIKMVIVETNLYGNYEKYCYKIENLKIGDEISIEYNCNVSYSDNFTRLSSFRIFFNSDVLKKDYRLVLTHHSELNIDLEFKNNGSPDSIVEDDNIKKYYWNKSNLFGCIYEEGSRPYLTLPNLTLSIKPEDLLYTLPNSFENKYVPFYSFYAYAREKDHIGISKSVLHSITIEPFPQIKKFVTSEIKNILNDTLGYLSLMKLNNTIVDKFEFENDIKYFQGFGFRNTKMGEYIEKKTLRDVSRYDLYVAFLAHLNLNYMTTYVCDKRSGEINKEYFSPMYDSDYLLAVLLKNNNMQFLYPKKSRFGYYLNEIPFYFENTIARLVHVSDYQNYKHPIKESERQITLPNSLLNDNMRKSNILVKINLDSLTLTFNSKINLFGQYSTLTRGLYQYNCKDETINKIYNKKIWELNDRVKLINHNDSINDREFPYPVSISAVYAIDNLIEIHQDTFSLSLKNWFNHIIYSDMETRNRQLDFYPDFNGKDSYVYYLEFNKNIKLLKKIENSKISNEFGELVIDIEQLKPNTIKITSFFSINCTKINATKIDLVKIIFDRIQELNNSLLSFKLES